MKQIICTIAVPDGDEHDVKRSIQAWFEDRAYSAVLESIIVRDATAASDLTPDAGRLPSEV